MEAQTGTTQDNRTTAVEIGELVDHGPEIELA
jgi:hypothetical protein